MQNSCHWANRCMVGVRQCAAVCLVSFVVVLYGLTSTCKSGTSTNSYSLYKKTYCTKPTTDICCNNIVPV